MIEPTEYSALLTHTPPLGPTPETRKTLYYLVAHCGRVVPGRRIFVLCDSTTPDIAEAAVHEAFALGADATVAEIGILADTERSLRRQSTSLMLVVDQSLPLLPSPLTCALAHRVLRALSEPSAIRLGFVCADPAVIVDYHAQAATVQRFADAFTADSEVRVKTRLGTDMVLCIDNRMGSSCPGFVWIPGDVGSPTDIKADVSPIETSAHGVAAVDGSIPCPELGLLAIPVNAYAGKRADRRNPEHAARLHLNPGRDARPSQIATACAGRINSGNLQPGLEYFLLNVAPATEIGIFANHVHLDRLDWPFIRDVKGGIAQCFSSIRHCATDLM